jgi:hypothetical protein
VALKRVIFVTLRNENEWERKVICATGRVSKEGRRGILICGCRQVTMDKKKSSLMSYSFVLDLLLNDLLQLGDFSHSRFSPYSSLCSLPPSVCFLFVLLFNPEDGGICSSKMLMAPSEYMALLNRTQHSSQ